MAGHLSSLAHRPAAGWQAMYFATLGPRLGILKVKASTESALGVGYNFSTRGSSDLHCQPGYLLLIFTT
jgi:hypothetical protein